MWTLVMGSLTTNHKGTLLVQWEGAESGFSLKSEHFQSCVKGLQYTGNMAQTSGMAG